MASASENFKRTGVEHIVLPLDSYILHAQKFCELVSDDKITKENIESKLREIYELDEITDKIIRESQ